VDGGVSGFVSVVERKAFDVFDRLTSRQRGPARDTVGWAALEGKDRDNDWGSDFIGAREAPSLSGTGLEGGARVVVEGVDELDGTVGLGAKERRVVGRACDLDSFEKRVFVEEELTKLGVVIDLIDLEEGVAPRVRRRDYHDDWGGGLMGELGGDRRIKTS
jgi:hypothetical protein